VDPTYRPLLYFALRAGVRIFVGVRVSPTEDRRMTDHAGLDLKQFIRNVPDFPKPGILFRDITPLLADPVAFRESIVQLASPFRGRGIDMIVAAEARGFIFATPLALELSCGFAPIRKPGKLPFDTHAFHYELEYGQDTLEMHTDGVVRGQNILVVDDLLATGGTVEACCRLVENSGATVVACAFLIELCELQGRQKIAPREVVSLIQY
jgi:adenine phosphoribosyltransferase